MDQTFLIGKEKSESSNSLKFDISFNSKSDSLGNQNMDSSAEIEKIDNNNSTESANLSDELKSRNKIELILVRMIFQMRFK